MIQKHMYMSRKHTHSSARLVHARQNVSWSKPVIREVTAAYTFKHTHIQTHTYRGLIHDKRQACCHPDSRHSHTMIYTQKRQNIHSAQRSIFYLFRASICLSRPPSLSLRNKRTDEPIPVNEPDAAILGTKRGPWGWQGERERQIFLSISPHCHVPPLLGAHLLLSNPSSLGTRATRGGEEERERETWRIKSLHA